jgi:Fur family ferric uptake transcriptional regulator
MPGVNVSTIYRTLDLLEGTGCIYRNKTTDHVVHCHLDDDHHQSLVCRECGKTIYCNERTFASLEKSLLRKYDFQVNFKQGAITGLCGECQSKTK